MKRPNIVLIVIDALRADALGAYGRTPSLTPALDRLAAEGILFERAYAASCFTPTSVAALLTGSFPGAYRSCAPLEGRRRLLAPVLRAAGYRAYAFSANPYVSPSFGYDYGWDSFSELGGKNYVFFERLSNSKIFGRLGQKAFEILGGAAYYLSGLPLIRGLIQPYVDADGINRRAEAALERHPRGQPFFLYLHYMDVHSPYLDKAGVTALSPARQSYLNRRLLSHDRRLVEPPATAVIDDVKKLYYAQAAYIDRKIGELVAFLRSDGRQGETQIIITSDHGEELFEEGFHNHRGRLVETLVRVPLVIIDAGRNKAVVKRPVSQVDLAASICRRAGVGGPYAGADILDAGGEARPVFLEAWRRRDNWMPFIGPFDPERHEKIFGVVYGRARMTIGPDGRIETNVREQAVRDGLSGLIAGHCDRLDEQRRLASVIDY